MPKVHNEWVWNSVEMALSAFRGAFDPCDGGGGGGSCSTAAAVGSLMLWRRKPQTQTLTHEAAAWKQLGV